MFVGIGDIRETCEVIIGEGRAVGIIRRVFGLRILGSKELDFESVHLQSRSGLIGVSVDIGRCGSCAANGYLAAFLEVGSAGFSTVAKHSNLDERGLGCFAPAFVDGDREVAYVSAVSCGSEFGIGSKVADNRPVIYNSHPFVVFGVEMEWVTGVEPATFCLEGRGSAD